MIDNFWEEAVPEMAYFKAGFYGQAGSGKTFTASKIAIGLAQHIKSKKPIAFLDTETGSDFVLHLFQKEGLKIVRKKSRAFSDLLIMIDKAVEKKLDIMIVDSITHVWNELIEAYLKKNEKKRLTLRDWQPLKATWADFTDRYVNSRLHMIWCSRSADVWEEAEDPEDGSKELRKTGTKPRVEAQLGYEPSLLVELEAVQLSARVGGHWTHRAYVKKDRFDVIDGQVFDNPTFDSFSPHIALLNLGGEHKALEVDRNSQDMFERGDTGEQRRLSKEILLEKISNEIKLLYPGQTEIDKTAKIKLLQEIFESNSWTEISTRHPLDRLEAGLKMLRAKNTESEKKPKADKPDGKPKKVTAQKEARA